MIYDAICYLTYVWNLSCSGRPFKTIHSYALMKQGNVWHTHSRCSK